MKILTIFLAWYHVDLDVYFERFYKKENAWII